MTDTDLFEIGKSICRQEAAQMKAAAHAGRLEEIKEALAVSHDYNAAYASMRFLCSHLIEDLKRVANA